VGAMIGRATDTIAQRREALGYLLRGLLGGGSQVAPNVPGSNRRQ